jgi:hypothetical protein
VTKVACTTTRRLTHGIMASWWPGRLRKHHFGKLHFEDAGSATSHGRLPLESRSHGRAVPEFFSSAAALARSTLMRSWLDSAVAGGATVSERTCLMKLVPKSNAMKRTSALRDAGHVDATDRFNHGAVPVTVRGAAWTRQYFFISAAKPTHTATEISPSAPSERNAGW